VQEIMEGTLPVAIASWKVRWGIYR